MESRYDQAPGNGSSSEFEMIDVQGGEFVCEPLLEPQEVEQRTGIHGYSLMGSVVLRGDERWYAESEVPEEEFLLFQGEASARGVPRLTHATMPARWSMVTMHQPLSVAVMPATDFRQLIAYNRELPTILASTEALRAQGMWRSALRTLVVNPGSFEMLDRQFHHGWPELQKSFVDNQHCVVAVDPDGRVVVRDFAQGGSGTYVRRRRQS